MLLTGEHGFVSRLMLLWGKAFVKVPGRSDLPMVQTASHPRGVGICWSVQ